MVDGKYGSTCSNDRHESVTPWSRSTGAPDALPRSAYCSVTPVGRVNECTMICVSSERIAWACGWCECVAGLMAGAGAGAAPRMRDDVRRMSARGHAIS
jgi:hypothetical protein